MAWSDFGGPYDTAEGDRVNRPTVSAESEGSCFFDPKDRRSIGRCKRDRRFGSRRRRRGHRSWLFRMPVEISCRQRQEAHSKGDRCGDSEREACPNSGSSSTRSGRAALFAQEEEHFREFGATGPAVLEMGPQLEVVDSAIRVVGVDHFLRSFAVHRPPNRSSDSRSFCRPRNIRTLIVPSGQSRVAAISRTERPSQK